MNNVINISSAKYKCRVVNIRAKDLITYKYYELNKFFNDRRTWTLEQKNSYIESLLFGIFVPQFFIYENNYKEQFIIDGYNRIKTFYEFYNDKFPLSKMSKHHWYLNGKLYNKLNVSIKYKLDNYPVILNVMKTCPLDSLKELYINLNT